MKYLLLLLVIVGAAWWMLSRRGGKPGTDQTATKAPAKPDAAQTMLACAHCGLHLPELDALRDGSGRAFCSEAHRLAGPH